MNPPPNASIEKRTDSLSTTPLERPRPEPAPDAVGRGGRRRRLDLTAQPPEADHHRDPDDRVADDDGAVGVERRQAAIDERLAQQPRAERARRRGDVADEVVPGERRRPPAVGHGLAERRLLDGEERADLVAGRGDDPDRADEDEQRQPARVREDDARDDHQGRAGDQDPAPAEAVGVRRQPQRDDRVADERQGQHDADRQRIEAGRGEVEDEDDGQEPVAEHAQRPHREQEPPVPVEPAEAGDEAGIDARVGRSCHARRV